MALVHRKLPNGAKGARGRLATSSPTALPVCPICTLQRAGLAAASERALFGTVGDIDQRIPAIGLRADGVETSQQEPRQLPKKQRLPGKPASTPRSRHGNAHLAQRGLIRLWRRSSKHMQEPWLTRITTSGVASSSSRTVAAMANSARLRLMS